MKTLLLLRHGKSSWKDTNLADHDRPLKKRGENDAQKLGDHLNTIDLIPDIIYCSTAKRARDTVKFLLETLHYENEVFISRSLYHSYIDDFIDVIHGIDNDLQCLLLVGHNPGLEEFLSNLTDIDEWLPTAALAQVEIDIMDWRDLTEYTDGRLINIWRPREITGNS